MKKLFILLVIISSAACSKVANHQTELKPFFSGSAQVTAITKATLNKYYPNETLVSVDRITYTKSVGQEYAFVFYSTNKATRSLVVQKPRNTPILSVASITTCWGACECSVQAIFHNDGSVDVGCTCSGCKPLTSAVSLEN